MYPKQLEHALQSPPTFFRLDLGPGPACASVAPQLKLAPVPLTLAGQPLSSDDANPALLYSGEVALRYSALEVQRSRVAMALDYYVVMALD